MDRRRVALVVALVASLAAVVGLSVSLLSGVGTSSTETGTTVPRQDFFNIAQGITRFNDKDLQTMAATGIGTDRFLLDWAVVEPTQGSFNWPDRAIGALASHGIRLVPYLWGSPRWVADTPRAPARQRVRRAGVAGLPPGGGGALRAGRQLLGPRLRAAVRRGRQAAADPVLADLERAQSREVLRAQAIGRQEYARLLEISHDVIKSQDPQARIVLAGMPGFGKPKAWDFLDSLYAIPGFKGNFDAAALHPYAPNVDELGSEIEQFRAVMTKNGDGSKPLWLTELAWGAAAPDKFRLNKGLPGQADLMAGAFRTDPEPPKHVERAAPVLVRLARSGSRGPWSRRPAASAAARGC